MKVPTAFVQHGADFYKKGFSYKRRVQKLWRHLLIPVTSYEGTAASSLSMAEPSFYKGTKRVKCYLEYNYVDVLLFTLGSVFA